MECEKASFDGGHRKLASKIKKKGAIGSVAAAIPTSRLGPAPPPISFLANTTSSSSCSSYHAGMNSRCLSPAFTFHLASYLPNHDTSTEPSFSFSFPVAFSRIIIPPTIRRASSLPPSLLPSLYTLATISLRARPTPLSHPLSP